MAAVLKIWLHGVASVLVKIRYLQIVVWHGTVQKNIENVGIQTDVLLGVLNERCLVPQHLAERHLPWKSRATQV